MALRLLSIICILVITLMAGYIAIQHKAPLIVMVGIGFIGGWANIIPGWKIDYKYWPMHTLSKLKFLLLMTSISFACTIFMLLTKIIQQPHADFKERIIHLLIGLICGSSLGQLIRCRYLLSVRMSGNNPE